MDADHEPMAFFFAEQNRAGLQVRFQIAADHTEVPLKILQVLWIIRVRSRLI